MTSVAARRAAARERQRRYEARLRAELMGITNWISREEISRLIAYQWLPEHAAGNRDAVARAIKALLRDTLGL